MHKLILYQSSDTLQYSDRLHLANPGMLLLAKGIIKTIRDKHIHTVVIEGPPGVGKTTMVNHLMKTMTFNEMDFDVVSTDDDVLPRSERVGIEIIEFHPGAVVREAINMKASGGGQLSYKSYNSQTGAIDMPVQKNIQAANGGVFLVDGVRSIEYVMRQYSMFRHEYQSRVLYILLSKPAEIVEQQRAERDALLKGLSQDEISRRIQTQRSSLADYYKDLEANLKRISNISFAKDSQTITANAL